MLTIVTASHRNPAGLACLGKALDAVLSPALQWIVKDSGQCDASRDWAAAYRHGSFRFDPTPDAGIYDALNRAVAQVITEYYLVVGSDDRLDGTALATLVDVLGRTPAVGRGDIITLPVHTPAGTRRRKRLLPLWVSSSGLTSSHSVGTLIRTSLHADLGAYDVRYRILADSLFLRLARLKGARFEHRSAPVVGTFMLDGVSSRAHGRRLCETYSYQIETGGSVPVQAGLLLLRLCRYRPSDLL